MPFVIHTCGEIYTPEEARFLRCHGDFFRSLMNGERSPTTQAQQRFVKVCHGEAEPESVSEKVWSKYLDRLEWESDPANQAAMGPSRKIDEGFGGSRDQVRELRRRDRADSWRRQRE